MGMALKIRRHQLARKAAPSAAEAGTDTLLLPTDRKTPVVDSTPLVLAWYHNLQYGSAEIDVRLTGT